MKNVVAERRARLARMLLIGVLPAVLLSLGVARYVMNHFYARAPYLLDSGLLSGLTYRDGLLLRPPPIACDYAHSFYEVYVSPMMSAFSAVSYVVPVGRIEWFAIVEAIVYVPFGIAVGVLASRVAPATALRRLPATMLAAFAFAFSGLVIWTIGFPHFEVATAGLTCTMLGCLVTGRIRAAWIVLALAVSVRQDAGLHVAVAIAPLLYLHRRGVAMAPSRRQLVIAIAAAFGASVAAVVLQKLLLHPADRLHEIYLGDPAYAHLTRAVVGERTRYFLAHCQVIYYPAIATLLIAILTRDPRYLLGWAAMLPWFVFNFAAKDPAKAEFTAYVASPFLVSVFWVYLYGAVLAPPSLRLHAAAIEVLFALVCLASTLGYVRDSTGWSRDVARDLVISHHTDREAVDGFVHALHTHRDDFKRLRVDYAVAALALEWLDVADSWHPGGVEADTIAFHHETLWRDGMMADIISNQLATCTHVIGTQLVACSRAPLPPSTFAGLRTESYPAAFAFTPLGSTTHYPALHVAADRVTLLDSYVLRGWLGSLPAGTYEWRIAFAADAPVPVLRSEMARLRVLEDDTTLAEATLAASERELVLRFTSDGTRPVAFRLESRLFTPLAITGARLRRVTADADPDAR